MSDTVWIACYDCGETTEVPTMGKYQTRQLCPRCKQERRERYMASLGQPPKPTPPAVTLTEAIDLMLNQGVLLVDAAGNCYARPVNDPQADAILIRGLLYPRSTE